MTEEIFRQDAYARTLEATVVAVGEGGIELDRTIFYPEGGGQPGGDRQRSPHHRQSLQSLHHAGRLPVFVLAVFQFDGKLFDVLQHCLFFFRGKQALFKRRNDRTTKRTNR